MNISNLQTVIAKTLVGTLCITGSLLAAEREDQSEKKHISVGDREMTHVDKVKIQEKRALLFQKIQNGEDLSGEESVALSESEQQEIIGSKGGKEFTPMAASKLVKKGINATTYHSSHEGAFHHPLLVSLLGDTVELEDGSIWAVCSNHRYKTLDWMTGDIIIILPNHDWFSVYNYRMLNTNTGANIKVNLSLGPIYNGIFTHWILAIDYNHREICLEDGSIWKMSSIDQSIVGQWMPQDTVIIGIYDGLFSGSNPNMLINVNMNNYAIGKCVY